MLINYDELANEIYNEMMNEISDKNDNLIDASTISRNLRNKCKLFNDQQPFYEFPINNFSIDERKKFIKKLYLTLEEYTENRGNRQILDNLEKNCTNIDISFLYNMSDIKTSILWKTIVDEIKDEASKCNIHFEDENGKDEIVNFVRTTPTTPIGKDMVDILNFYFQNDKEVRIIISFHTENESILYPEFRSDRNRLISRYTMIMIMLLQKYQYLYEKICVFMKAMPNYDYCESIFNYFDFIIDSFLCFCNVFILQNTLIEKEKKIKMLNNLYKNILTSSDIHFKNIKTEAPATDIFHTFNIFLYYFVKKMHTSESVEIYSFLLEKTKNTEYFKPIKDIKYIADFGDPNFTVDNLREEIKKDSTVTADNVNKVLMSILEDILTEGEGISGFEKKFKETQEFISFFNDFVHRDGNKNYIYELKVFFREIFVYKRDCQGLSEHLREKLKESSTRLKTPLRIMREYQRELLEKNNVKKYEKLYRKKKVELHPFKTTIEYRFITALLDCGSYREASMLDEYAVLCDIKNHLTESLLNIFLSFDYNEFMQNLYKVSETLTELLSKEFENIFNI